MLTERTQNVLLRESNTAELQHYNCFSAQHCMQTYPGNQTCCVGHSCALSRWIKERPTTALPIARSSRSYYALHKTTYITFSLSFPFHFPLFFVPCFSVSLSLSPSDFLYSFHAIRNSGKTTYITFSLSFPFHFPSCCSLVFCFSLIEPFLFFVSFHAISNSVLLVFLSFCLSNFSSIAFYLFAFYLHICSFLPSFLSHLSTG
jgi:hypothetical protein